VFLAWVYSSHSDLLSIDLVDNETRQFMVLWSQCINISLIVLWIVTLATLMYITRVRNLFWVGGNFLCVCYVVTLSMLLVGGYAEDISWYRARLFETVATLLIIFVLLYDVFNLYRESHLKYQQSYQNSIRDPLTRLYNRSYFYDSLNQALAIAKASRPVSVIVSDLDRFKRINDNYGHLQGDKVLQFVSNLLMDSVRPQDIAARIGGEEFVLMLENTSSEEARQVAERIRIKLSSFDKTSSEGQLPEPITISMGVFTATSPDITAEKCVESADKAMYEAKETGRNRVVIFQ
jgi:diguanylate cyclase (GGDEF)-like protein